MPYPHAVDDHQTRNAAFLVNAGAAQLLPQSELDAADLADRLSRLSADRGELMKMAGAARALAQPDAAERVGRACLEVMNHE